MKVGEVLGVNDMVVFLSVLDGDEVSVEYLVDMYFGVFFFVCIVFFGCWFVFCYLVFFVKDIV